MQKLSDVMMCVPTFENKCQDKASCEAPYGGECHGGGIENRKWVRMSPTTGHQEMTFENACLHPAVEFNQPGWQNRCGIDLTAPRVEAHGSEQHPHYYDPLHHEIDGGQCAWYNTTQAACGALSPAGEWVSTEQNENNCQRIKQCEGGRGSNWKGKYDTQQCTLCEVSLLKVRWKGGFSPKRPAAF